MNVVMVTGGAGFVGSHLVGQLLLAGSEVHVFDALPLADAKRLAGFVNNPRFHYTQGDLRDEDKLAQWYVSEAEHIFHLASVVGVKNYMDDPLALIDIVVGGTRTLLELAVRHGTRVLFTSTSEIYGKNPGTPWKESDDRVLGAPSVDRWSYSTAKATCEHMLYALHRSSGLQFTTVRFFNVYGPSQAPIFVASQSVYRVLRGEQPFLYDTGKQTRCFTFVDDAVRGMLLAATSDSTIGEVLNIGSDVESTVEELVGVVIDQSGTELQPKRFLTGNEYGHIYEDIQRRVPDVSKAKKLLDWRAETSLAEGVKKTLEWSIANEWWLS